ncbi:MAG: hypothetical protein Q9166_000552 [cf. Caloplaca sp. 2 TL-2023]
MTPVGLVQRVEELSDLELALLLSFVATEHCLIETEDTALDSLQQELQLIVSTVYSRTHVVIECTAETTLDELVNGLFLEAAPSKDATATENVDNAEIIEVGGGFFLAPNSGQNVADCTHQPKMYSQEPTIADVVILKDLNLASYDIQIQALELIRTKRVFTHTAFVTAPKSFCMVIIQSTAGPYLNKHLNDHIFLSHYHDLEDGFPNLENAPELIEDDRSSSSSVVRNSVIQKPGDGASATFSETDIQALVHERKNVTVTAEVECYLQNIVTFLRMHRAVDGGINPRATKYFKTLVTCLAPLHGLDYVTPSLVAIAARKIYPHRINLTVPERDRSLQYGSDLAAVKAVLEGVSAESVIEDVLAAVETPL